MLYKETRKDYTLNELKSSLLQNQDVQLNEYLGGVNSGLSYIIIKLNIIIDTHALKEIVLKKKKKGYASSRETGFADGEKGFADGEKEKTGGSTDGERLREHLKRIRVLLIHLLE
ncbi:hypothetical protein ACH5RR_008019 [Cinchona calisaya]|uniref:Uncharacterized protein n=1 Tax=Cinchona calisaya TaxID=153742 RepID=A0ABD3AD39_9GENT